MTPVLDVRGLAFAYPDGHQALYGVDLHVHRGERVALLGPCLLYTSDAADE